MQIELQEIYKICVQIRKAILKVKDKTLLFKNFPAGCCRDCSIIIGKILTEKGFKNITYCRREIDEYSVSHVWLEYENHIIDITANQFTEIEKEVIVKSNVCRNLTHTNPIFKNYLFEEFFGFGIEDLLNDLKIIKENM